MRVIRLDPSSPDADALAAAIDWLRAGRIVAYPTDTLYGLAVDPESPDAVQSIFDLKGRDVRSALPLIAASAPQVRTWCGAISGASARLADHFWPGPLALILDAPANVAPDVHGGAGTIAIRVPAHPVARALAAGLGRPITATSANRSGAPAVDRVEALGDLAEDPRVLTIDAGPAPGGPPSTIVDARSVLTLVREGAVAWSRVLGSINE